MLLFDAPDFQPKSRAKSLVTKQRVMMPSTYGLRRHTTPRTDGNAPTGELLKVRGIVGPVQPERLFFVSPASVYARPGKKNTEPHIVAMLLNRRRWL